MSAYSEDLRSSRIVSAVAGGMSKAQPARTFCVSLSSLKRYVNKTDRGESLAPQEEEARIGPEAGREGHEALGGGHSRAPLREPSGALRLRGSHHGYLGEPLHNLPRHSPPRPHQEKGGRVATERDGFERATWRVMVAATVEPERLIFVDECGTHTSLAPIYGYAPRSERLRLSVPRRPSKNTTLLSSMTLCGMGPSLAVEGASTALVFEAYVERVLAPSLRPGRVVVMDNLGAHRPKRVRELIEGRGCELWCTCRPTLPTTTRSRRPSPRSRTSYATPPPGPKRHW